MVMDFFSDGALSLRLVNGMVRIEFASASVGESDNQGNPVAEPKFRVVMTPHGFMKTFGNMEKMMASLSEAGVIQNKASNQEKRKGPGRNQSTDIKAQDRRSDEAERRKLNFQVVE
jgi:hypothetical protein